MYKNRQKTHLKALTAKVPGLTQAEMVSAVVPHRPEGLFPGGVKVGRWVKDVQFDLEAKRQIQRALSKALDWHKPPAQSACGVCLDEVC